MRKTGVLFLILFMVVAFQVEAQMQIDHSIQLVGVSPADCEIQGIQTVANSHDAVNVDAVQKNSLLYGGIATGSNGAYIVSLTPAPSGTTLTTGMTIQFTANSATSTGAALTINGLTPAAVPVLKNYNNTLGANDIQSGQVVSVIFDGNNFQMLSQLGTSGGGGALHGKRMFNTPGTYSFTAPAGVTAVWVSMCGGGGGGGGGFDGAGSGGGGGGADAYMDDSISVTPGSVYTVTVGSGAGGGPANSLFNGANGGQSSFISPSSVVLLSAQGGNGGLTGSSSGGQGRGGTAGGQGGSPGTDGDLFETNSTGGGAGGGCIFGQGAGGGLVSSGKNAGGYGAGGGGGNGNSSGSLGGGFGSGGFVRVEW